MTVKEVLKDERFIDSEVSESRGDIYRCPIVLMDGTIISVDANSAVCCKPNISDMDTDYESVQLGINDIQRLVPTELGYLDGLDHHTLVDGIGFIFDYVPIDIIDMIIGNHGGINIELTMLCVTFHSGCENLIKLLKDLI